MKTKHSATTYRLSLIAALLLVQFFAFSGQVLAQANVSSFSVGAGSNETIKTDLISTITIPDASQSVVISQPTNTSGYLQVDPNLSINRFRVPYSATQSTWTSSVTVHGTETSSGSAGSSAIATGSGVGSGVIFFNTTPVVSNNTAASATVSNNASAVSSNSSSTASNPVAVINTPASTPVQTESAAVKQQGESQTIVKQELPTTANFALSAPAAGIKVNSISVPATVVPKISTIAINAKEATHVSTLKELQSLKTWQAWKDPNTNKVYKVQAKTVAAANVMKAKLNKAVKTLNMPKTAVIKKTK